MVRQGYCRRGSVARDVYNSWRLGHGLSKARRMFMLVIGHLAQNQGRKMGKRGAMGVRPRPESGIGERMMKVG